MQTEQVVNLNKRTGILGLALFVKGHVHDSFSSSIVQCNGSADFCLEVLKMDPLDLMVKFEQWSCAKDRSRCLHVFLQHPLTLSSSG